ncbi:uncharacterized protein LOC114517928 [Dendronephthya gigantea]|uniref:uncharacterized protein LOC114517928 n=1 Tax=Dendronephthya gigantea TaxID=151771 RepID=UPI00106AC3D5|nr:uncharacterized protein LOC114517928 [Dendronephthya gigantea]
MAMLTYTLFSYFLVFGAGTNSSKYVRLSLDKKNPIDPGQCDQSNHGEIKLVQDRLGADRVLICTEETTEFLWQTIDGSSTVGEYFNPALDCSDVVDRVPDATDGFYWINSTAIEDVAKAWCDVTTDGGGYLLVAKKDDAVTWTVPSTNETVDPFGKPHWSSIFGKINMLDIRFQISTTSNFKDTKAHWSFRLANTRPFGQLLVRNSGGCTKNNPGIGDISFVKDLQTGKVVNRNYRCSLFSGHLSRLIGWGKMNRCLQQPCSPGFAYFGGERLDDSGSFSYSAHRRAASSGILHSSTAFVGCSYGKCCACYGPKGGTKNYCSSDCTPINEGEITKNVHVWIWVRSSIPKRAWRKCIEYVVTNKNGNNVTYSLDEETGTRRKGNCAHTNEVKKNGAVRIRITI